MLETVLSQYFVYVECDLVNTSSTLLPSKVHLAIYTEKMTMNVSLSAWKVLQLSAWSL